MVDKKNSKILQFKNYIVYSFWINNMIQNLGKMLIVIIYFVVLLRIFLVIKKLNIKL